MEQKGVAFEVKDISRDKRTITFAHAIYSNIDRGDDISEKGMFTKSWQENPTPDFLYNHKEDQILGKTIRVFDSENKAYTEGKFGRWKLADDVMEMADEGVLRGASFGYVVQRKEFSSINGKQIRRLKQVYHGESSLLTKEPMNPLTKGEFTLTKEQEIEAIKELKASIDRMESYCRKANASDETIISLLSEIEEQKHILSKYDTAPTQVAPAQGASETDEVKFAEQLQLLTLSIN